MLLQILPVALVALMWASPAFAAAPTSRNDPFRAIAIQVMRRPDPPVCCLRPLTPTEPVEDEVFLSFEEWKAKQFVIQEQVKAKERLEMLNRSSNGSKGSGDNGHETSPPSTDLPATGDPLSAEDTTNSQPNEPVSPHFRVPLTDRFNYASLDCSSRVHASHRSAKSSSSILSSKRDRYMLSPCNSRTGEKQFVVVELCEDVRIDTVQLANFEFFSGVFKEFSISVIKTYTGKEDDEWTLAGTYKAKNIRGVQSFHPPTSLRDFYRYIRIDFLSHYSNEFYCPVSLLRVYGLTHLEQWKWYMWEEQSKAKRDEKDKAADLQLPSPAVEVVEDNVSIPIAIESDTNGTSTKTESSEILTTPDVTSALPNGREPLTPSLYSPKTSATTLSATSTISTPNASIVSDSIALPTRSPKLPTIASAPATNDIHEPIPIETTPLHSMQASMSTSILISPSPSNTPSIQHNQTSKLSPANANVSNAVSSLSRPISSTALPPSPSATTLITSHTASSIPASVPVIAPPVVTIGSGGGESIYRTIMNRLTALEANHTLYTRYVEQQTSGVRDVLKRLGEDIGRLEGIGRAQTVTFQRTVNEWEARQRKLQMDYGELMSRIEYLSDEIVLEKRLGIAQLCLLLAVLVFMGLTRGSRGEPLMVHGQKSMREWGKRHLSFSGDWTARFGRGRNGTRSPPKPHPDAKPLPQIFNEEDIKIAFPRKDIRTREPLETSNRNNLPTPIDLRHTRLNSRSLTPSIRSRHHYRPMTPTPSTFRPRQLQRSNSQGGDASNGTGTSGTVTVPRGARKWAKTPHLHEVRNGDGRSLRRRDYGHPNRENGIDDIFSVPATAPATVPRYNRRDDGTSLSPFDSNRRVKTTNLRNADQVRADDGADLWVDTEEESEVDWDVKMEPGRTISFSGNEH